MGMILKASGIALICVFALLCIKNMRNGFAPLIKMTGTVLLFGVFVVEISPAIELVGDMLRESGTEYYATVMLKALAIAFVTRLSASVCRDSGESGIAAGVESVGKAELVILSLPLLGELLEVAGEILKW